MNTKSYHLSNFGSFSGSLAHHADAMGYVTYHVSDRYELMSDAALRDLATSGRYSAVRAAADTELADRAVAAWRKRS